MQKLYFTLGSQIKILYMIWFNAEVVILCFYINIQRHISEGLHKSPIPHTCASSTSVHTLVSTIAGIKDCISVHFTGSKLDGEKVHFLRGKRGPRSDSHNTAWLLFIFSDWLANVCWEQIGNWYYAKQTVLRRHKALLLSLFLFFLLVFWTEIKICWSSP